MTSISMNSAAKTSTEITLRVANALGDVERAAWDACANPLPAAGALLEAGEST
jgi:hypothetical protein